MVLVIFHAVPVLLLNLFVSHDGPAHLDNANIINNLLLHADSPAHDFFEFNPIILPNWTGHVLLMLFNYLLPAWLAEKLLLLLYIITFPLAYRYLLKSINPEALSISYLVFPFIYTLLLYLGFYNFLLSIPLMLFVLACWLRKREGISRNFLVLLASMFVLLYFTHLLNFLILLGICGANLLWDIFQQKGKKNIWQLVMRQAFQLFLTSIPALVLALLFIIKGNSEGVVKYMKIRELISLIYDVAPMSSISGDNERIYSLIVFCVFAGLLLVQLGYRQLAEHKEKSGMGRWGFIVLLVLVLFFSFPTEASTGGFISHRLSLFFFLFLGFFIATLYRSTMVSWLMVFVVMGTSLYRLNYYYLESKKLSDGAFRIYEAGSQIEDKSTVLPLNYSNNWLFGNVLHYAGCEKDVVILENYEADKIHFPLVWKKGMQPNDFLGNHHNSKTPWVNVEHYEGVTGATVDYILRFGYNEEIADSNTIAVNDYLEENFSKVLSGGDVELFKRNR